jgi:hypothetical protein
MIKTGGGQPPLLPVYFCDTKIENGLRVCYRNFYNRVINNQFVGVTGCNAKGI